MNVARTAPRRHSPARTEAISHRGKVVCMIVRAEPVPDETTFYTPHHCNLQVGKIVYPAGSEVPRHAHRPVIRHLVGTPEVLVVQKGRMIVDVYADDHAILCSREVSAGDVVVLLSAGHGFRLLEDTVLLEVKQGPYVGPHEKELF
jgi:quercetin dioxygenase-like cupin family protein